jgi:hypothetical protein
VDEALLVASPTSYFAYYLIAAWGELASALDGL